MYHGYLKHFVSGDTTVGPFSTGKPFPVVKKVHVSHFQSVLSLPDNATPLASSALDMNQAFVVGKSAWGVQFHPEFDAQIAIKYIHHHREALLEEQKDPDRLIEKCVDTP